MKDSLSQKIIEELSSSKNKVTRTEIRKYYQQQNIDFPKNKDGNPNMSYLQNKETYQKLFKRKLQRADVVKTHGSNKKIKNFLGNQRFTSINLGLKITVNWFKKYYNL